jgi:hypothetical protein
LASVKELSTYLFSSHALQDLFGKYIPRIGHAECGRTGSRFGLDDFINPKLSTNSERLEFGRGGRDVAVWMRRFVNMVVIDVED